MITVRYSETYDLSTQVGKLGLVGIHTPSLANVAKLYPGLCASFRNVRMASCDVAMACASMLPADPLQIGVEAGSIAPQDMFNPILYRAVSNESYNTLLNRIVAGLNSEIGHLSSVNSEDVAFQANTTDLTEGVYYSLLADPDGWRHAMPQSGLQMTALYPIVYSVVNTFGNNAVQSPSGAALGNTNTPGNNLIYPGDDGIMVNGAQSGVYGGMVTFRGPSMRMPSVPTVGPVVGSSSQMGFGMSAPVALTNFPQTYVACLVLPPAKLNRLYYRLKVVWTIEFSGVRPHTEVASLADMNTVGNYTYDTDYASQSQAMTATEALVDTRDVEIKKIMEGS